MIITKSDIELVKKNNNIFLHLWIDPFYIQLLESYFELLDGKEFDSCTIQQHSYINNVLEVNNSREEAQNILWTDHPIQFIQKAINEVCRAKEEYEKHKINNVAIAEYEKIPEVEINGRTFVDKELFKRRAVYLLSQELKDELLSGKRIGLEIAIYKITNMLN